MRDPSTGKRAISNGQINRVGASIRANSQTDEEVRLLEEWRASHLYILNTFQANLRTRTRNLPVVVAQRLKRRETIYNKLQRQPSMQLSRMHDVAGCRLIFEDVKALYEFRGDFHKSRMLHKLRGGINKYDYIHAPKLNGYRGVHDVYEYLSKTEKGSNYNGLLVELQYRTMHQHAWATAVEVAGLLTKNRPKFDEGDADMLEFFACASEIVARAYEDTKSCRPDLSDKSLVDKFSIIDDRIRLLSLFESVNMQEIDENVFKPNTILIFGHYGLDEVKLTRLSFSEAAKAVEVYNDLEKNNKGKDDIVLVKADQYKSIRSAFRNYFADTADFVVYVRNGVRTLAG